MYRTILILAGVTLSQIAEAACPSPYSSEDCVVTHTPSEIEYDVCWWNGAGDTMYCDLQVGTSEKDDAELYAYSEFAGPPLGQYEVYVWGHTAESEDFCCVETYTAGGKNFVTYGGEGWDTIDYSPAPATTSGRSRRRLLPGTRAKTQSKGRRPQTTT